MFASSPAARADTLVAHLARHLAPSAENVAIEALGFVLARSPAARTAFTDLAGLGGAVPLSPVLTFATQAGDEDVARPDIEGYAPDFRRECVVECKFWAGLTANQPTAYARRLRADGAGALVFVVPSARLTTLYGELTARLKADGLAVGRRAFRGDELSYASLGASHGFVLVSWRALLATLRREMDGAGEVEHLGDLLQLEGLCERMDRDAFLPLRSEELTSLEQPRRHLQLAQLVFDIGTALVAAGHAKAQREGTRLMAANGASFFGRYLHGGGATFLLSLDYSNWTTHQASPLWIKIEAQRYPAAAVRLRCGAESRLGCRPVVDRTQSVAVPVPLRAGVERPAVVEAAMRFCADAVALFADGSDGSGQPSSGRDGQGDPHSGAAGLPVRPVL